MIDNTYNKGFEGEIDVEIYYVNDTQEKVGYRLWDGYFENILSGAYYENHKDDGLLDSYCLHKGWYDETPWKLENINSAIEELNNYDEKKLEPELEHMYGMLRIILNAIKELFKECKSNMKDIYIDYDS